MDFKEAFSAFESYNVVLIVLGLAVFIAALLPRLTMKQPFSMPIALLALGYVAYSLPLGLKPPDPRVDEVWTEHLTEMIVIVALMGAGLKIDRPFAWKTWGGTWRLLGITMILSIALSALAGWWIAGFVPATALLLGAIIAPTDPVLATDIQVGSPGRGSEHAELEEGEPSGDTEEDEFRFILTSEAGLNDGLAFPFTNAALLLAVYGLDPQVWTMRWLGVDVLYKLGVGVLMGLVLGRLMARVIFAIPASTPAAKAMVGPSALAATLLIYGFTELIGAYGFLATFVGAVMIRSTHREHPYHHDLHIFSELTERLLIGLILVAFGATIAGGLLNPLTWPLLLTAIVIVFLVRPLAGIAGLIGFRSASLRERWAIAFFGVRGIGSFYYLAYALNRHSFEKAEELWALTGLIVIISIFVHGIAATPVTMALDRYRKARSA